MHPQLKASGIENTTFKLKQSGHGQVNILYNNWNFDWEPYTIISNIIKENMAAFTNPGKQQTIS